MRIQKWISLLSITLALIMLAGCASVSDGLADGFNSGYENSALSTTTSASATATTTTTTTTTTSTTTTTTTTTTATTTTTTKVTTTTTTKTVTTTVSNEEDSYTVYVTPTGKRYHLDPDCGGKNSRPATLEQALGRGLTPCKKCAQ